jgi:glyoxylase-like metal-dependent hydrolase (beta-lactamase superfamily II)
MKPLSRFRTAAHTVIAIAAIGAATGSAQHQRPPAPPDRLLPPARAIEPLLPPAAGEVGVLPVQGNVYMLNLGDVNIAAQVGDDGILLVDTGPAEWTERVMQTLRERFPEREVRVIVNTHLHPDHTGGNAAIGKLAGTGRGGGGGRGGGPRVIAHENTFNRMSGASEGEAELPQEMLPTSTFFTAEKELYFNGEPIEVLYRGAGHTDGDVLVFFRGSDVIAAGDLFLTTSYPILDEKRGSSFNGYLGVLNYILDLTVPRFNQQGGTMVIPGHGRLSNESDVDDYRNWMTIVRDRVQEMIKKGMTLPQVKAAKPTLDFDGVFTNPRWTTDQFVEAVYRDLSKAAAPARTSSN